MKESVFCATDLSAVAALQDECTARWHQETNAAPAALPSQLSTADLVVAQHQANYQLWHFEDDARASEVTDRQLAELKRSIDCTNQSRNDLAEQIDSLLLKEIAPLGLPRAEAELHSESPGLMIDRLSILSLKLFHTQQEVTRLGAPDGHTERNRERLSILVEQRSDLSASLCRLWERVLAGQRRFKLYRQLKMYNDPALNPVLYKRASGR